VDDNSSFCDELSLAGLGMDSGTGDNEAPEDEEDEVMLSLRSFVNDSGEAATSMSCVVDGYWKGKFG